MIDLRTYGEDEVAAAIASAGDEVLQRIFDRADYYVYSDEYAKPSGASPFLAQALSRAAVESWRGLHGRCAENEGSSKASTPATRWAGGAATNTYPRDALCWGVRGCALAPARATG